MNRSTSHIRTITGIFLVAVLSFRGVAIRAEVVISEIMYDPQNADANREWVELFNTGTSAVNIGGWQFGVPSLNDWGNAVPVNTMLNAGQALVLTPSAATLDGDWGSGINRLQIGNFPSLTNDPNGNANAATVAIRNGS